MTKKELLDKIGNLPDDYNIKLSLPMTINGRESDLHRFIERIDVHNEQREIIIGTNWSIKLYY